MINYRITQADIRVKEIARCSLCGTREEGGRYILELPGFSECHLPDIIEEHLRTTTPRIPVGWVMNGGRDKLVCPQCKKEET